MNIKCTKPSEASSLPLGALVRVKGRICGRIIQSSEYGGRLIIPVCDIDSQNQKGEAVIVVNREPDKNPHLPAGIKEPGKGLIVVFTNELFSPLFKKGTAFEAEAVLGFVKGEPWFNVFHWIIFEPHIAVGVRQIIGEPICQRRILLANRGVHLSRKSRDYKSNGALIFGDLVHLMFQEMVIMRAQTDASAKSVIATGVFESKIPLKSALQTALLVINDSSIDTKGIIDSANRHFKNLINSPSVMSLIKDQKWDSEVPLSVPFVHGKSDLRCLNMITELKTGIHHSSEHLRQLGYYLVADMLGFGTEYTSTNNKGFLVRSSSTISNDSLRVTEILPDLDLLNKFLVTRHRYILVMANHNLPKIEISPSQCEECLYFKEVDNKPSACHFYCQIERDWKCDDCLHSKVCKESHVYHSYEAIDEANKIRLALLEEIRLERYKSGAMSTGSFRLFDFSIEKSLQFGLMVLSPKNDSITDPPRPGSPADILFEGSAFGRNCEIVDTDYEDRNKWLIALKSPSSDLDSNSNCSITLPQGRIRELFDLLFCIDEMQRNNADFSKEGLAFAGGQILSREIDMAVSLETAFKSDSTDIFCQSFSLKDSYDYLDILVKENYDSALVITESRGLERRIPNAFCLSTLELNEAVKNQKGFETTVNLIKKSLEVSKIWIVSPDYLTSDLISFLPNNGDNYFQLVLFFETHSVNALEYYLMRRLGRKRIVIGDANTLGKIMDSSSAIQLGLDNNVMHRVFFRGFPSSTNSKPVAVKHDNQHVASEIINSLEPCKLVMPVKPKTEVEFSLQCHEFKATVAQKIPVTEEFYIENKDDRTRTLTIKADDFYSESEIQRDLENLPLFISLNPGNALTSPLSGNRYRVVKPPQIVGPDEFNYEKFRKKWIVEVIREINNAKMSWNKEEAMLVAEIVKDLLSKGVKHKNVAVLSPFIEQLNNIGIHLGNDAGNIALRTPYSISGCSWGTVIISCVLDSLIDCPQDVINPRMFYTMIRAGSARVIVVGNKSFIENHPFLRNII